MIEKIEYIIISFMIITFFFDDHYRCYS